MNHILQVVNQHSDFQGKLDLVVRGKVGVEYVKVILQTTNHNLSNHIIIISTLSRQQLILSPTGNMINCLSLKSLICDSIGFSSYVY